MVVWLVLMAEEARFCDSKIGLHSELVRVHSDYIFMAKASYKANLVVEKETPLLNEKSRCKVRYRKG